MSDPKIGPAKPVTALAPVVPTPADVTPPALKAPELLPSGGMAPQHVGEEISAKQDSAQRQVLARLQSEIAAAEDGEAVAKALTRAHDSSPVSQAKSALFHLRESLYGTQSYVDCLRRYFAPTDAYVGELKEVARALPSKVGQPTLAGTAARVRYEVLTLFEEYIGGLHTVANTCDDAIGLIGKMPKEEAIEMLLTYGAADRSEAEAWQASLKDNRAAFLEKCVERLRRTREAFAALQTELDGKSPERQLAVLCVRYPAVRTEVADTLGASPKLDSAIEAVEYDKRELLKSFAITGAVTLSSFLPIVGTAAAIAEGAREYEQAEKAATHAAIGAALGLVDRERAELLDDEISRVVIFAGLSAAMSLIPGGGIAAALTKRGGATKALHTFGDAIKNNPGLVAGLVGALNTTMQADVRKRIADGDYFGAALSIGSAAAANAAVAAGMPKLAARISERVKKLLEKKVRELDEPIVRQFTTVQTKASGKIAPNKYIGYTKKKII